jgi:uncharacterized coiled-coil DUF342 family protein
MENNDNLTFSDIHDMRAEWLQVSARAAAITREIERLRETRAELEKHAAELSREYRAIVGGN